MADGVGFVYDTRMVRQTRGWRKMADGIGLVYDHRPDRNDYEGYSAVLDSFIDPILPHFPEGFDVRKVNEPIEGYLNVRFYTWPQPHQHLFMSHGIADKQYRTASKIYGFEWVHTSGPWWTDYYKRQGRPPKSLVETGYPKLDPLFGREPKPRTDNRVRVLWAPTHAGINGTSRTYPSSYLELVAIVEQMLPAKDFDVTLAPHPRLSGKVTLEEYVDADVVIADAGSTLYEAWALDKPVVFPAWVVERKLRQRERTGSLEGVIYRERIGYHVDNPPALRRTVEQAAVDGITPREQELIEQVLPRSYRGSSGKRTAEAFMEIARGPVPKLIPSNFFWIVSPDGSRSEHVTEKAFQAIWRGKGYTRLRGGDVGERP